MCVEACRDVVCWRSQWAALPEGGKTVKGEGEKGKGQLLEDLRCYEGA